MNISITMVVLALLSLNQVTKDIEDTIALTIQNTLNSLESDCLKIIKFIENKIEKNTLVIYILII